MAATVALNKWLIWLTSEKSILFNLRVHIVFIDVGEILFDGSIREFNIIEHWIQEGILIIGFD